MRTDFLKTVEESRLEASASKASLPRSCHIGNNTANNWAVLKLFPQAYLVQYDHTTYGLDDVCAPWLILDDYGIVSKCFDPRGNLMNHVNKMHINIFLRELDKVKYSRHLNYAIPARHEDKPLFNYFYGTATELAKSINQSKVTFDSEEMLGQKRILALIFKKMAKEKELHLVFHKWVAVSKKGYLTIQNINRITYETDKIQIYTKQDVMMYNGFIDDLINRFFDCLENIKLHIVESQTLPRLSYPWVTLQLSYLIPCIRDYSLDNSLSEFQHAGGSASQYYVNESCFSIKMNKLVEKLIRYGYLPENFQLKVVPSFSCQLFATTAESSNILENMLSEWRSVLNQNMPMTKQMIYKLTEVTEPRSLVLGFKKEINRLSLTKLKTLLDKFNSISHHKLPIAHIPNINHNTYNKYGIKQNLISSCQIHFPENIMNFKWGELDILVKLLAEISISSVQ